MVSIFCSIADQGDLVVSRGEFYAVRIGNIDRTIHYISLDLTITYLKVLILIDR